MNKYVIATKIKSFTDQIGITNILRQGNSLYEYLFAKTDLQKNIVFHDKHLGRRCFLLGTSISLNNINLKLLSNEIVMSGNFIFHHEEINKLHLSYYFLSEPFFNLIRCSKNSVFWNREIDSESKIIPYLTLNKEPFISSVEPKALFPETDNKLNDSTKIFLHSTSKYFVTKNKIFKNKDVFYTLGGDSMISTKKQAIDLTKRISFQDGTLFTMIAAAMYMGIKEIYLIGMDYSLKPTIEFHFYDSPYFSKCLSKEIAYDMIRKIADTRKIEIYSIEETDEYYKPIFIGRNGDYSRHAIVQELADSMGIKIYNLTPPGFESPIYKKISWEEVLSKMNSGSL